MKRLAPDEVAKKLSEITNKDYIPDHGNWLTSNTPSTKSFVYFSQCKPSTAGSGNWHYDFFHSLSFSTIDSIARDCEFLILVNYVDRTFAKLHMGDLLWLSKYSTRNKVNNGLTMDIVIERNPEGGYHLRPYDRFRPERRNVEVERW